MVTAAGREFGESGAVQIASSGLRISVGNTRILNRPIEEYEQALGISRERLLGKKVLDVGSGGGSFLRECAKLGIDAIGIDPVYASVFGVNMLGRPYKIDILKSETVSLANKYGAKIVAGVHEALPFKEDTFDFVLGCYSSVAYAAQNYADLKQREQAVKRMVEETIRVLKPGGEARITLSANNSDVEEVKGLVNQILQEASKGSNRISWEFLDIQNPATENTVAHVLELLRIKDRPFLRREHETEHIIVLKKKA